MSKRRRAGAGRRIAEQRFWDGGSGTGGPPARPTTPAPVSDAQVPAGASPDDASPDDASPDDASPDELGADGPGAGGGHDAGGHDLAPTPVEPIRPTTDPAAVVRSLGAPPFSMDASVAERHLTAVYEEAVRAATALAAANGLLAKADDAEG
jgi:hypothetical protein